MLNEIFAVMLFIGVTGGVFMLVVAYVGMIIEIIRERDWAWLFGLLSILLFLAGFVGYALTK